MSFKCFEVRPKGSPFARAPARIVHPSITSANIEYGKLPGLPCSLAKKLGYGRNHPFHGSTRPRPSRLSTESSADRFSCFAWKVPCAGTLQHANLQNPWPGHSAPRGARPLHSAPRWWNPYLRSSQSNRRKPSSHTSRLHPQDRRTELPKGANEVIPVSWFGQAKLCFATSILRSPSALVRALARSPEELVSVSKKNLVGPNPTSEEVPCHSESSNVPPRFLDNLIL